MKTRTLILSLFGLLLIGTGYLASGTAARLLYIRELPEGETEIVTVLANDQSVLTLPSTDCFSLSDDAQLVAVSEKSTPVSIRIASLETNTTVFTIPWQSDWSAEPCSFLWITADTLGILVENPAGDRELIEVNITNGAAGQPIPLRRDLGAWQVKYGTVYNLAQTLPNLVGDPSLYMHSPLSGLFLYERCVSGETAEQSYGKTCRESPQYVIYDTSSQQDVEILQYAPYIITVPTPLTNFLNTFAWSPSGRYLAYRAGWNLPFEKVIYDLETDQYITIDTPSFADSDLTPTNTITWSPDEKKIAFWLDASVAVDHDQP